MLLFAFLWPLVASTEMLHEIRWFDTEAAFRNSPDLEYFKAYEELPMRTKLEDDTFTQYKCYIASNTPQIETEGEGPA